MEKLEHLLTIRMKNFYKDPPSETYEAVFTSCSIPYPCKRPEHYLRKGDAKKYFGSEDWLNKILRLKILSKSS